MGGWSHGVSLAEARGAPNRLEWLLGRGGEAKVDLSELCCCRLPTSSCPSLESCGIDWLTYGVLLRSRDGRSPKATKFDIALNRTAQCGRGSQHPTGARLGDGGSAAHDRLKLSCCMVRYL